MGTAFWIGLAAGLAATPHCLGMCGGFPLHLARQTGRGKAILRPALFVLGKSFTYVFLGALAGAMGIILFRNTGLSVAAPAMRMAAGVLMVIIGLGLAGVRVPLPKLLPWRIGTGLGKGIFSGFLTSPGPLSAFLLGLGAGFLPCPLPMAMLAAAAAGHHVPAGMAMMAGVGLGTAPGLLAIGLFGVGLDRRFSRVGMRLAGIVVILMGLMILGRATGLVGTGHAAGHSPPACCGPH